MPFLHLLRHGIAGEDGPDPPLSPEGEERMRRAARGMARLGLRFDVILASPLKRAAGTAAIVQEIVGPAAAVRLAASLQPGCRLAPIAPLLVRVADESGPVAGLLLVGHQPDVGRMASDLIGARNPLAFGRGTICRLELPAWTALLQPSPAALSLLLPAAVLESLG